MTRRLVRPSVLSAVMLTFVIAGGVSPPPAAADSVQLLRDAVAATRAASCNPLGDDPVVTQAAYQINLSNVVWLNHESRAVPAPDALPVLKDLGYQGNKATILYGAGKNEADSIKALVLQGYAKIPDCSY
ncbi:MAG TPA: hypothetical protein VGA66_07040, partial [Mycobacterium sp.]